MSDFDSQPVCNNGRPSKADPGIDRRKYLTTVVGCLSVVTAGCGQSVPSGTAVESDANGNPGAFTKPGSKSSNSVSIPANAYRGKEMTLFDTAKLEYELTVKSGPSVDVYLLGMSELEAYKEPKEFEYIDGGSMLDTQGGTTAVVLPGKIYTIVVDNTRIGPAAPPSEDAAADVELTAQLYGR